MCINMNVWNAYGKQNHIHSHTHKTINSDNLPEKKHFCSFWLVIEFNFNADHVQSYAYSLINSTRYDHWTVNLNENRITEQLATGWECRNVLLLPGWWKFNENEYVNDTIQYDGAINEFIFIEWTSHRGDSGKFNYIFRLFFFLFIP